MRVSLANEMLKKIAVTVENRGFPACYESKEQYQGWLQMERLCPTQPVRRFVCEDCLPRFKTQMMFQKKCSNPNYVIKESDL